MNEITLEKIDILRERTGVTYAAAKEALEITDGEVVEALIYLEKNTVSKKDEIFNTAEELIVWLKELVKKGNVNRIRIKKEDKIVFDVPVTAGIATGLIGLIAPALLAIIGVGTVAAVFTDFTIEITRTDGSVEVVNKIIKTTANTVKEKVSDLASDAKEKFNTKKQTEEKKEDNVYKYTVKFDDIDEDKK